MFKTAIEKAIKKHIAERDDLAEYKGVKVLRWSFQESVVCSDGRVLVKYSVVCKMAAKKYENNRIKFQCNIYDNDEGIYCYFDGTFYEKE